MREAYLVRFVATIVGAVAKLQWEGRFETEIREYSVGAYPMGMSTNVGIITAEIVGRTGDVLGTGRRVPFVAGQSILAVDHSVAHRAHRDASGSKSWIRIPGEFPIRKHTHRSSPHRNQSSGHWKVRQFSRSSSLPSPQSFSPSHIQLGRAQTFMVEHLKA